MENMPMPDPSHLSKRERQIMDAVYARGQATAADILKGIPHPPSQGALRTLLRILERKGHLKHHRDGRAFIYAPTRPQALAGRSALGRVLNVFFGGSLEKAVAAHLSDPNRRPDPDELRRLARLIKQRQ
jgi:predicted transcriptional regulator